jgi:3-methylcrotonyl-CoA carboxylase alpha subunit
MIAKLVVWGKTRDLAIKSLSKKLENLTIAGLTTNQQFLLKTLRAEDFKIGNVHTGFIEAQGPSFIEDSEPITAENLYLATLAYLLNRKNQNQFKFQQSPEPNSPWNSLESWRTNLPSSEKVVLAFGEKSFEVGVKTSRDNQGENHGDNYVLSWEDDKAHVMGTLGPDSQLITKINDKDITLTTCLRGDDIYLMGGGTTLQFHRISKSDASLDDQNGPGLITAPMPGRIIEILVKKDDGVSQGDPLVIMETMKMEYTLKAGKNGFVKDIKISLEDQVKEGDPVISIGDLD